MQEKHPHLQLQSFFERLNSRGGGALALDYDGTLAPFQVDRDAAVPYPGVAALIRDIQALGRTRVVLISGRPAEEVRRLLGVEPAPEIWGAHGRQRLRPDGSSEMAEIRAADRAALEEAGIAYDEELVCGPQLMPGGTQSFLFAMEHMLRMPDPITAIFAINENVALMVQQAADKLGLLVPGDIELAGFFDAAVSDGVRAPSIRVVQAVTEIGQTAAGLLLDRIAGRAPAEPQHILIPARVMEQ